jgi:cystathionine beta-lyase
MSSGDDEGTMPMKTETALVTAGRDTKAQKGFVNPPVVHGSTVLYPTADDLHAHRGEFQYGRHGTPTTRALQQALMALEGPQCAGVGIAPSGLAAITTALLAVLKAGDHILVCDNVYRPSRNFCNGLLSRYGVEITYFDSQIGAGIADLFTPNTRAVLIEAPGSQSFEMPDVLAIASAAHARGAIVIDDNTWATPLFHRSLEQGVDISIQAATKYIGGHSDIMFGTISANVCLESVPVPTTSFSRSADYGRSQCGSRSTTAQDWKWPTGWPSGQRSCGCFIRRLKAIPATQSGSGISPGHRGCSASF